MTGATGFVGSNLVKYLVDNRNNITILTRGQLQNKINLGNADVVIHLAGKAHDLKKISDPSEYFDVNFDLTKRVFDAFLASQARKFIFLSSVKAVADSVDGVLTEDHFPNPKSAYGKSKLLAEQYIEENGKVGGKTYFILRPCMIHGPGNKGNLNLLYKFVKSGFPYPLAKFENRRSYLGIENLQFIINQLIKKDIYSNVFNIADDGFISTNDIVRLISNHQKKSPMLWCLPKGFVHLVAKIGDAIHLPLDSERLQKLTESYMVDNSKIKRELDIELPNNIRESLIYTVKSFK